MLGMMAGSRTTVRLLHWRGSVYIPELPRTEPCQAPPAIFIILAEFIEPLKMSA